MPFVWKVDPLKLLKEHGYTTYRIRKEKIFCESSVQKMRKMIPISLRDMDTLCTLTDNPIENLIVHTKEKD